MSLEGLKRPKLVSLSFFHVANLLLVFQVFCFSKAIFHLPLEDQAAFGNSLNNLKTTAIQVEYQQLNDTVNVINTVLEETLSNLFDEPIQVVLSMFKILKTGGRVKPEVNLHIMYKGAEYDAVSQLSGGEGDRVSLAIIIALGIVSNSKLLLLDECLSSIGGELRESAVEMIRKYNTRTVLIIDHEAVEGIYDKTVKISKLGE